MNTRRVQNYGLLLWKRFLHICSPKTIIESLGTDQPDR